MDRDAEWRISWWRGKEVGRFGGAGEYWVRYMATVGMKLCIVESC